MGKIFKIILLLPLGLLSASADPAWWAERNVVVTNQTVTDFGLINLGQLKHMATQAYLEFDTKFPSGASSNIANLVASFSNTNNFAPVNIGQLKTVTKPYYDQLISMGYTTNYPWTPTASDDADFGLVNVGQLKTVFAFDPTLDSDGDKLFDFEEELLGTNPFDVDSDNDGINDFDELMLHNTDPTLSDSDGDGIDDGAELAASTDPNNNDTSPPTLSLSIPSSGAVLWLIP